MLLSQTLQNVEAPKAATSSRSVLYGIMKSPSSFGRYKVRWEVMVGGSGGCAEDQVDFIARRGQLY